MERRFFFLPFFILSLSFVCHIFAAPSFRLTNDGFEKDGQPFRIISGSMHYFRTHPSAWLDRLEKMKKVGLNTVQTVIPWNIHQPQPDQYVFDGFADIEKFITLAHQVGLLVILRPGPYICAEWENGGIPYWVLTYNPSSNNPDSAKTLNSVHLRSADPKFMAAFQNFFQVLLPRLATHLYSNGGPVIMVQVENEYGSFGNDKEYLREIQSLYLNYLGDEVIIYATDGPTDRMLQATHMDGVYQTIDFGPTNDPSGYWRIQRKYQPTGPLMNSEYYTGWLCHWYEDFPNVSPKEVATGLDIILSSNASVNMFMFEGGTNFGFLNGANADSSERLLPSITSYDYNAPLTEAGDPTPKYFAIRDVLAKYTQLPPNPPSPNPKGDYGKVELNQQANLFENLDALSSPIISPHPQTFEELSLDYGFLLYKVNVSAPSARLEVPTVRDRAQIFLNGVSVATITRGDPSYTVDLNLKPGSNALSILVENLGRINYGPFMYDPKGLPQGVKLGGQFQYNYTHYPLPLTDLSSLSFSTPTHPISAPTFFRGYFNIPNSPLDTFLKLDGFTKGVAFINGFNLGRYWSVGPQFTLYVPAAVLIQGVNEVIIFELHSTTTFSVQFVTKPEFR